MNTFYSYKDIVLQPAYSEIQSRSSLDVSVKFLGKTFESAAIPHLLINASRWPVPERITAENRITAKKGLADRLFLNNIFFLCLNIEVSEYFSTPSLFSIIQLFF